MPSRNCVVDWRAPIAMLFDSKTPVQKRKRGEMVA
jgi:DNA helicase IV